MWNEDLIPHIDTDGQYRRNDVLNLLKSIGIDKRTLPRAFLRIVDWIVSDRPITGTVLIEGLRTYKPVRGRKPTPLSDKKAVRVPIRLTEREQHFIQRAARVHHLSTNAYILAMIFNRPLPSPEHGLNIETAYDLDCIEQDLKCIKEGLWEDNLEFVSLRFFGEIDEQIARIKKAMTDVHRVVLDMPPKKEKKNKSITIVMSPTEKNRFEGLSGQLSAASVIRSALFSNKTWTYCRSIKRSTYDSLKTLRWDLSLISASIKTGESVPIRDPLMKAAKILNIAMFDLAGYQAPDIPLPNAHGEYDEGVDHT